nr:transposase, MuDR, MULE transposase domain protein [Tanacetum cinerariifolium]
MSMYVNDVNVVNENKSPSSEKVVGQLIRKRFIGKALVEPYTMQPPTTALSSFLKVNKKRLKRKARLLEIQNTKISFDDVVGDDDPDFKVLSLEEWRYSVECAQSDRKWNVYTRKVKIGNTFIVSNCRDIHSCSETQINLNHRKATMKLLGNILFDKIRDSNKVYKIKDIQHDMRVDWKIDISYKRAWGGRNMALHIINGSHVDSFSQLPYYYNLKLANEGTVTHIHTDADERFEMLYVGFGFAFRSFLRYMRPLIIIDGAHLKGNYLGTNLLAVGMDGNNQIIPLATGVSQGKTGES